MVIGSALLAITTRSIAREVCHGVVDTAVATDGFGAYALITINTSLASNSAEPNSMAKSLHIARDYVVFSW